MAIKTKKIVDLQPIDLTDADILGYNNGVTGKIPYTSLVEVISSIVDDKININDDDGEDEEDTSIEERINEISDDVVELDKKINTVESSNTQLVSKCKELKDGVEANTNQLVAMNGAIIDCDEEILENKNKITLLEERIVTLEEQVEALLADNEKLVQFIKNLQPKDNLTLAVIKSSAATAFPISSEDSSEE